MSSGSDHGAGRPGASSSAPAQPPPPFITLQSRTLSPPDDGAPGPSASQSPGVGRDGDNTYPYFNPPNHHPHASHDYHHHDPYPNGYNYYPQYGGGGGGGQYNGGYHTPYPPGGYHHPPPPMGISHGMSGQVVHLPKAAPKAITHDISRTRYHIKHIGQFADTLEESAKRAFPNRGRPSRRYNKVFAIMLRWETDDLDVVSELEDLNDCFRQYYSFETECFVIPSTNSHLDLMIRICQLIKDHEAPDTLLIVYYGGHARIDDARQSTWVATRQRNSPWLQWSAIQTLLERSKSDVLLLLDCCSGAASASFPTGESITEAISASSWDAIAPEPGMYSFTNILIEVLREWRTRTFSVAMLHAEMLARLKHPRPIVIQGKLSEVRATPVHFMMTANHKAPSIEITRLVPEESMYSPPPLLQDRHTSSSSDSNYRPGSESSSGSRQPASSTGSDLDHAVSEPDQDTPHVMISLALEEDQALDVNAWTQWLSSFPALAKYVKVQGVFRSHSTLMLLSMPVMIWDLLPDDHATSFVAFIRSGNLAMGDKAHEALSALCTAVAEKGVPTTAPPPKSRSTRAAPDHTSFQSKGTTLVGSDYHGLSNTQTTSVPPQQPSTPPPASSPSAKDKAKAKARPKGKAVKAKSWGRELGTASATLLDRESQKDSSMPITKRVIPNQVRSTQWSTLDPSQPIPECPEFAPHVEQRLEMYYKSNRHPNNNQKEYFASNLGIEPRHVEIWYHHHEARQQEALASGMGPEAEPVMISAERLDSLLQVLPREHRLILDVRSDALRQRRWIDDSIHFRVPADFIDRASVDQIGQAFSTQRDMDRFARWLEACCLVFYSDDVEFTWECPSAKALLAKLRDAGWGGRCFILSGPFSRFRKQFSQHIQNRKDSVGTDGSMDTRQRVEGDHSTDVGVVQAYEAWVELVDRDAATVQQSSHVLAPSAINDRRKATDDFERMLANEFTARFPVLYKESHQHEAHPPQRGGAEGKGKGKLVEDEATLTRQAALVPHLDRGLEKMRSGAAAAGDAALAAKLAAIEGDDADAFAAPAQSVTPSDDYVDVAYGSRENSVISGDVGAHAPQGGSVAATPGGMHDGHAKKGHRKLNLAWRKVLGRKQ